MLRPRALEAVLGDLDDAAHFIRTFNGADAYLLSDMASVVRRNRNGRGPMRTWGQMIKEE
jgi:hypothetical protein